VLPEREDDLQIDLDVGRFHDALKTRFTGKSPIFQTPITKQYLSAILQAQFYKRNFTSAILQAQFYKLNFTGAILQAQFHLCKLTITILQLCT
jgi:uncharacterized protein YjbI with pentapeptide repeats